MSNSISKVRTYLEMIIFVFLNIIFSDLFFLPYFMFWLGILLIESWVYKEDPSKLMSFIMYFTLFIPFFLRCICLPIMYSLFEKYTANSMILNFIKKLKNDCYFKKKVWLLIFIFSLTVNFLTLYKILLNSYNPLSDLEFSLFDIIILLILIVNPITILYLYWWLGNRLARRRSQGIIKK